MRRRLLLAYPLVEALIIWALAQVIGWGSTLLVLLLCLPIGFALMKSAGRNAFAELQAAGRQGLPAGRGSRHVLRFAAGLLIAVPGLLSTLAGLLLLMPWMQRIVRRWVSERVVIAGAGSAAFRQDPVVPGTVVPGTVVPGTVVDGDATGQEQNRDEPRSRQEPSPRRELGSEDL